MPSLNEVLFFMLLNKQCEVLIFECIKSNKVINEQFLVFLLSGIWHVVSPNRLIIRLLEQQ